MIAERQYRTLGVEHREHLRDLGFPAWALVDEAFPGLLLTGWDVHGGWQEGPHQWKPARPLPGSDGEERKYTGLAGKPNRIDVHPRWTRAAAGRLPALLDVTRRRWITEGYKKADKLTSLGEVAIALAGVWNWRTKIGGASVVVPDFDALPWAGVDVVLCFDSDARTKTGVALAMRQLGEELTRRGAVVRYCIVPGPDGAKAGVDDFLVSGGTLQRLEAVFTSTPPEPPASSGSTYFDQAGLKAVTLAEGIRALGPLAYGADDITWSYAGGVWSPDRHVVQGRATALLGERYRNSHAANAVQVIRARSPIVGGEALPDLINFTNGLLCWRTGELRPHTPEVMSTVQMGVAYHPAAVCPEFDRFLAGVVPPDMIGLVWELIGYLMFSGNPLHIAVMLTGKGRNGKGTLLRVITRVLGRRNVTSVSLHDLVNVRFSTASLFGKLANIAGDIDGTYIENTATFKAITGEDSISAEHKGRDRFDFTPWAVPVFSANKVPASADATVGYLSRWLVINFPHDFTGREDRTLDARLQTPAELEGIAARAMPALARLMARGRFELPASAAEAKAEFERKVDQVRAWADDRARIDPALPFINRAQLFSDYRIWADENGGRGVKGAEFYERLARIGPVPVKVRGVNGFRGIALQAHSGWRAGQ